MDVPLPASTDVLISKADQRMLPVKPPLVTSVRPPWLQLAPAPLELVTPFTASAASSAAAARS